MANDDKPGMTSGEHTDAAKGAQQEVAASKLVRWLATPDAPTPEPSGKLVPFPLVQIDELRHRMINTRFTEVTIVIDAVDRDGVRHFWRTPEAT